MRLAASVVLAVLALALVPLGTACTAQYDPDLIAAFDDTRPDGLGVEIQIRKWSASPTGLAVVWKFDTGGTRVEHAESFTFRGMTAYRGIDNEHGDFYVRSSGGDLQLWDGEGIIRVAERI